MFDFFIPHQFLILTIIKWDSFLLSYIHSIESLYTFLQSIKSTSVQASPVPTWTVFRGLLTDLPASKLFPPHI